MFEYAKRLIDKDDPARAHAAITLIACVVMSIVVLGLAAGCIFGPKNLLGELTVGVTALTGLAGYQYGKAKYSESTDRQPSGKLIEKVN